MFTVTGSPALAFADAILADIKAYATAMTLLTGGVYASLPRGVRKVPPYLMVGRRDLDDQGGAMQLAGGHATVFLDVWSKFNGPAEAQQIQSCLRARLMRRALTVSGFTMIEGSLTCVQEFVMPDPDPDMPEQALFHGVQQWVADLEESL